MPLAFMLFAQYVKAGDLGVYTMGIGFVYFFALFLQIVFSVLSAVVFKAVALALVSFCLMLVIPFGF